MSSLSHSQHLALEAGARLPRRSRWVAHGVRSMRSGVLPLFVAFSAVLTASTALVYRSQWCQLQAYAVVLLVAVAFAMRAHVNAIGRLVGARLSWRAFCAACGARDTVAVQPGAFNVRGVSLFETVYPWPTPLRTSALLPALWAAWLAYGALFHEGVHVTQDDSVARQWLGGSNVSWLRTARTMLLFAAAFEHLFSGHRRRDSVIAVRAAVVHCAIVLCLALFPEASATPQSLSFALLIERAMLCVATLLLTERLERVRLLVSLMRSYDVTHAWCMAVVCMARGEQPPDKIGRASRRELEACTDSLDAADRADDDLQQYRDELLSEAVDVRLALSGGWLLLVSADDARLWASIQLALTVLQLAFNWRRVHALLDTKSDLFSAAPPAAETVSHRTAARSARSVDVNQPANHFGTAAAVDTSPKSQPQQKSSHSAPPMRTKTRLSRASSPPTPTDAPTRRRSNSRRRRRVRAEPPVPAPTAADSSEMTEESDESTSDDSHETPPSAQPILVATTAAVDHDSSSRPRVPPQEEIIRRTVVRRAPTPPPPPPRLLQQTPGEKMRRSPPTSEDEQTRRSERMSGPTIVKRRSHSPTLLAPRSEQPILQNELPPSVAEAVFTPTLIPHKRSAVSISKQYD